MVPAVGRTFFEDDIDELAKLLNDLEDKMAWPAHTYHNLTVLMRKRIRGTRPIALMPMINRLWTKIRGPHIDAWDATCRAMGLCRQRQFCPNTTTARYVAR